MNHLFKRTLSLLLALAMIVSMVPGFGIHAHAEELDHEGHDHATEAAVEVVETESAQTPAPTEAVETEAPVVTTEAPAETEAPVVEEPAETEAPVVETEAPAVETEAPAETEAVEETTEATEEMIVASAEAMMATASTHELDTISGLTAVWTEKSNNKLTALEADQGDASWSAGGTTITGTATGYKQTSNKSVYTTLTLTNSSGSEATLKFEYTLDNGSLYSGGSLTTVISGTSGVYEKKMSADESVVISLKSPTGAGNTCTLTIKNLSLISTSAGDITATFKPAVEGGSYTVADVAVKEETLKTSAAGTTYALVATPASGYQFFGWYDETNSVYLDYSATYSLTPAANMTVVAKFVTTDTAIFGVGAAKFDSLTEAGQFAVTNGSSTIILLNDGTVSGSHVIPAGITLLVPFDDANTLYTTEPGHTNNNLLDTASWVQPTAYRTLTLSPDATITVKGAISVSAKHYAGGSLGNAGSPTEKIGFVKMNSGSSITLEDGASLYAWGFITGSGEITAQSGAKIYENFQIRDFRGGGATTSMASDGIVFPLSQYYVQNIEVPTHYEYGAEEHVYTSLYMSGNSYSAGVKFIGAGAMFQPQSGCTLTKDYIESKDRLSLTVDGNAAMANMSLELAGTKVDSSTFILPINNNISINIKSGTTTLKQDMALLPGVEMTIAEGATLNIASGDGSATIDSGTGYNLFVYDLDEWSTGYDLETFDQDAIEDCELSTNLNFVQQSGNRFIALTYAPGRTYTRTASDLKDVKIDINGTLVADGFLYTTLGGANIISSGKSGVVKMVNGAGEEVCTYQAGQVSTMAVYYAILVNSVQLKNGDGTYLSTAGAAAGTTYNYCASHDGWYTGDTCEFCVEYTVTYVEENGNTLGTETVLSGKTPKCEVAIPDKASTAQYTYTAAGWDYTGDGVADTPAAVTANITYKAAYTATLRTYDVVFYDTDGTTVLYTAKAVAYGSKPIYEGEMEKWEGTCVKYSINVPTVSEVDGTAATLSYTVSWTAEGAHNWTPASCEAPKTCSVCGKTEGEKLDHLWVEVTEAAVASTCVTKGSKTYFCTRCQNATKTEEQPLNPGNHTGNNTIKDAKEASCTEAGYTGDTVCECGETVEKGVTIPAKGHLDDDRDHICNNGCGVYQGEHKDSPDDTDHICDYCHDETDVLEACSGGTADCTHKANCKVCGKEYGELDESNHNWSTDYYDNDGETHTKNYFCLNNSDHTKSDPPAPHVYVNGECECGKDQSFTVTFDYNGGNWSGMTQNETWTLDYGTTLVPEYNGDVDKYFWRADMQKQYCTFAGWKASTDGKVYDPEKDSYTVTGDVTFTAQWTHKCELVPVEKVDATCMAEGNSAYWYCDDETCGKLYENADGTVETTLANVTIDKDPDNHTGNYTYAVNAKEASCTEAGYTGDTVCECGKTVEKGETIPAKNHSFTTFAYNEDATCTADGTETAECDNDCGETKTQTAEGTKLDHNMQESEPQVDATCETAGKTAVYTCAYGCGHTEGGEVIPATGHGTEEGFRYEENNDELNTHDKICGDCNEPVETKISCTFGDDHICDFCEETQSMLIIFMENEETEWKRTSVPYGKPLATAGMPLPTAPEGHEFAGWFTKDGTEIVNQMTVTTDLTAYAKWTPMEFKVTVKSPAGQENLILSSNTTATYGQDFTTTLSLTTAFEHGATSIACGSFLQGNNQITGEDIGAIDYNLATGELTIPAKYITADITIEAIAQVRFIYDPNGGAQSEENVILNNVATYGATIGLLPAECFVWENHTPVSYNTQADGKGTSYDLGGKFTANEDTTLYVIWQANSVEPVEYEGWTQIGGDWYYYDTETKQPVTGVVRVPYPAEKINGITYEANESGIAHADKNGYTYADLETALFVFGADGKFDTRDQMVKNGDVTSWSSDGMLDWRPGLVEVDGDYYYFEEDKTNGGNRMVIGDTYLRANNTDLDLTYRGIYTFGADGKICEYNGIVEMADGTLRYYEAWELMIGAGLVKVGDNYIYVRSNGELAVSTEYWVSDVNEYKDIAVGMYDFDENGFLVFADQTKNGIYTENGGLYLYKDGEKVYEGLFCYTGPSDNGVTYKNAWIYVRTNGQLATGRYWATKVDNAEGKTAGFYNFDANGIMDADKNGIVDENDTKYYYIKNERQYNLGVIELGGNYYYVRSNGEVVFGRSYWITNVGNSGIVPKLYTFDADGVMQNPEFTTSEGIVKGEEKGIWYYYVNGSIAYGAGVVYLEDEGCYIYVRSNGQLATGDYWPTTLNGELEPGMYNWGEDGKLYL